MTRCFLSVSEDIKCSNGLCYIRVKAKPVTQTEVNLHVTSKYPVHSRKTSEQSLVGLLTETPPKQFELRSLTNVSTVLKFRTFLSH